MHAVTLAFHSLHSVSVEVVLPADSLEKLKILAVSAPLLGRDLHSQYAVHSCLHSMLFMQSAHICMSHH